MLNNEIIKKIEHFVYSKPRSVDEIAKHIEKNWRTADRYITEIGKDYGTISTRVFREGTRGALKIVFWSAVEKVSYSIFQEKLEEEIMRAKKKYDFSPFDIFQHVKDKNREAYFEKTEAQRQKNLHTYTELLKNAEKQVLILSGNLSFINEKVKGVNIFDVFEDLVKRKISVKVICRVDFAGKATVERLLSLNFKYGREMIEIRHREQPLRGAVIDLKNIRLKEINTPTLKDYETQNETSAIYLIKDKEWVEWLSRIFWKMFSSSVNAKVRLQQMQKLKDL